MEEKEKLFFLITIISVIFIIILVIYLLNKPKKEQYILRDKF